MATIKISELFPIEEFEPDDLLEVVQDGKSRRASLEQLDDYIGSNLPITTEEDAGDLLQVDENGKWNKSKLIDKPNGIAPLDNSGKIPSKNLPLDISTTIDKTSTDTTVPTSKAVYESFQTLFFDVEITENNETYVSDKTFAEIVDAKNNNKILRVFHNNKVYSFQVF